MFVLVGDHGKDQVENLHKILSKTRVKANPSVLWCYKKELGFSTHKKKRMKEIKRNKARGLHDPDRDDPFDLFVSSTDIRWAYYKETDKIIGQTFGMAVLQDFEALTPNLLARTIETVEGGGMIILLLKTVKSLKQLYTISMDVHARFRTEAHHEIVPRFNERFILSLGECSGCLVLDDELNILPISGGANMVPSLSDGIISSGLREGDSDASGFMSNEDNSLADLKASLEDTPNVGNLVALAKTLDQAKAVLSFLDAVSEKTLRSTVALTAARGRGKSAAIGLCLAGAISYGYSNIFVTAPSPENLKTVFQFIISGLKALKYTEHLDFECIQEHQGDAGKCIVRINLFRDHRQTIQYILPSDHHKLAQAELVAIDEAAAIPLPTVKKLMGNYLVFMSSTVNGYEGTGRALSLKLIQQLRMQQGAANAAASQMAGAAVSGSKTKKGERQVHEERWKVAAQSAANFSASGSVSAGTRVLTELSLQTPIRYSLADPVEKWLNNLLCMDIAANSTRMVNVMPAPKDCELYLVNRDALFSSHGLSEALLQRIWALYTAAHYKNSPNDLQMLSDAPAHRLFVLLGPQTPSAPSSSGAPAGPVIPNVLCVLQVAFEGFISQKSIQSEMTRSAKASGDMIPWTISQQFSDNEFATLSGARVVRIATHPDVQKMGYGSRAMDLLLSYFQGEFNEGPGLGLGQFGGESAEGQKTSKKKDSDSTDLLGEEVKPRAKLPPLLTPLRDLKAEKLHWVGVSFGLTAQLLNFWSRKLFKVCYVRQTKNDLTGEHSTIMLRELDCSNVPDAPSAGWLEAYVKDYRTRLVSMMGYSFSSIEAALAISLVDPDRELTSAEAPSSSSGSSSESLLEAAAEAVEDISEGSHLAKNGSKASYSALPLTAPELITVHLSHHDLRRLELYARNMVDHHMIVDILPTLARLLFLGRLKGMRLSYLQVAILLATGLQHRDVDSISAELDLPVNQVLAFFNKTIRKIALYLREMLEKHVASELASDKVLNKMEKKAESMTSLKVSMSQDQNEDQRVFQQKQRELLMGSKDLAKHSIQADSNDLEESLQRGLKKTKAFPSSISVPITASTVVEEKTPVTPGNGKKNKKEGSEKKRKFNGDGGSQKKNKE
eukprot:CAMPEP_0119043946 /NCGR_PEP_ID=MMETSP1177-20130426/27152_1 /TAXON_ID=2985 /ORGANISM="Ochromonas sp, Strain CCMP1899" /LENGTH=1122 /DNA_ID=CAMNT_0007013131 /DNA_START=32 /DNA_END=3400 /DNA_ORIENTATION=-